MFSYLFVSGGSGPGRDIDTLPEIVSEDDVFETLLEEMASYEHSNHVSLQTEAGVGVEIFVAVRMPWNTLRRFRERGVFEMRTT